MTNLHIVISDKFIVSEILTCYCRFIFAGDKEAEV